MPDMKRLRDIDRRIIDADRLAFPHIGSAVFIAFCRNFFQRFRNECRTVDFKIEIPVHRRNATHDGIGYERIFHIFRNRRRRLPQYFRKSETRQREISHIAGGRNGDVRSNLLRARSDDIDFSGNILFVIHS